MLIALAFWTLSAEPASAQRKQEDAKREYLIGKEAYEKGDYQTAYDRFKQSYILSHQPALLYNLASALQGLGRPAEAAQSLRDYLKAMPNEAERASISKQIQSLEEAQKILDRDRELAEREAIRKKALEAAERAAAERAAQTPTSTGASVSTTAEELAQLRAQAARLESERVELERLRDKMAAERVASNRAFEQQLTEKQAALLDRLTSIQQEEAQRRQELEKRLVEQQRATQEIKRENDDRERRRRRSMIAGITVGSILIAGAGVGIAVGLTRSGTTIPFDVGPVIATP